MIFIGNLYALIGHPVAHSLSPAMHNEMFRELGLPHHYHAFDIHPENLREAVQGLRALEVAGFNVTIPHKIAILELLDEIDEEAKQIGAVNTVKNENGRLIGYNTDGKGYLEGLYSIVKSSLSDKKVLIIGAGGAAKGVAVSLARHGVTRLDLTNRTLEKAERLSEICKMYLPSKALPLDKAENELHQYDVIVNTTSVGMSPDIDEMPLAVTGVTAGTVMSDLIYNPLKTKWLLQGEKLGAVTDNGISMFVGQGALAFQIWTGQRPDQDRMKEVVLDLFSEAK